MFTCSKSVDPDPHIFLADPCGSRIRILNTAGKNIELYVSYLIITFRKNQIFMIHDIISKPSNSYLVEIYE